MDYFDLSLSLSFYLFIYQLDSISISKSRSRSLNLISEFRKWKYDDDGDPIDDFNHGIDAVRYVYVGLWGARSSKKITYKVKRR